MTHPLSHVGQTARPEGPAHQIAQKQGLVPSLPRDVPGVADEHLGVRFTVEAIPQDAMFEGRFTLLEPGHRAQSGSDDSYRPTTDNRWATPAEALTYATEAAHHAIEGILPFTTDELRGG
jgi:hypothetical protein